jgi:DNA-binding beta-propeller fold protein YncE
MILPAEIDVGNRPFGVVLSPDSRTAYVGSLDGTVIVVDVAARRVSASVSVPGGKREPSGSSQRSSRQSGPRP